MQRTENIFDSGKKWGRMGHIYFIKHKPDRRTRDIFILVLQLKMTPQHSRVYTLTFLSFSDPSVSRTPLACMCLYRTLWRDDMSHLITYSTWRRRETGWINEKWTERDEQRLKDVIWFKARSRHDESLRLDCSVLCVCLCVCAESTCLLWKLCLHFLL